MSFLSKAIGIGVAAAAAAVAVKVAKKYEENKELDALQEEQEIPETDSSLDAEPQPYYEEQAEPAEVMEEKTTRSAVTEIVENVQRAATDVWSDTRGKVKEAGGKMGVDADEVGSALGEAGRALVGAGKAVADAGVAVAAKVAEKAPDVVEKVKGQAGELVSQIKDTVYAVAADEEDDPEMGLTPEDFVYEAPDEPEEPEFPAGEEPREPLPEEEEKDPLI